MKIFTLRYATVQILATFYFVYDLADTCFCLFSGFVFYLKSVTKPILFVRPVDCFRGLFRECGAYIWVKFHRKYVLSKKIIFFQSLDNHYSKTVASGGFICLPPFQSHRAALEYITFGILPDMQGPPARGLLGDVIWPLGSPRYPPAGGPRMSCGNQNV